MNEPGAKESTLQDGAPATADTTKSGIAAVVCSILGCVGWIGLVPFLDPCDQGEQLARSFAALFNIILIAAVGGPATILLLAGWLMSRWSKRRCDFKLARIGNVTSIIGLVVGGLVLAFCLIPALLL